MNIKRKNGGQNLVFNIIVFLAIFIATFIFGYFFIKDFVPKMLDPDSKIKEIISDYSSSGEPSQNQSSIKINREDIEIVGEHPAVSNSFFENSLFIGDSFTLGLQTNTFLTYDNVLASDGLEVKQVFDFTVFPKNEESSELVALVEALKETKRPDTIYIMLGINSISKDTVQTIIDDYTKFIRSIQSLFPKTEIVVQSVLPITKELDDSSTVYDNKQIDLLNSAILDMCIEENVYYLNVANIFKTSYGFLHENFASPDGVHLSKTGYERWGEYIKTHLPNPPADEEAFKSERDKEREAQEEKETKQKESSMI